MMTASFSEVQLIMAEVFGVEPDKITMDSTPDTIESWDSLRLLNLILAFEKEFNIEIQIEQLPLMLSTPKILEILNEAMSK
jgi:acyl carrier protein